MCGVKTEGGAVRGIGDATGPVFSPAGWAGGGEPSLRIVVTVAEGHSWPVRAPRLLAPARQPSP